jgi:hypothetical protein
MRKIKQETLVYVSKRKPGPKKQIMLNIPADDWAKLEKEIVKTGMPVSRYIYAVLVELMKEE